MPALYLHVPSCPGAAPPGASPLVEALLREAERHARPPFLNAPFQTLYVGGGRPSALPLPALRTLIESCQNLFARTALEEVTLELHPADASPSALAALRALGITRLSIGAPPSARPKMDSAPALPRLLRAVRAAEFLSLSVDLYVDRAPPSVWKKRLRRLVALRAPHVALYEGSVDTDAREAAETEASGPVHSSFAHAMRFLAANGYQQYELTHFARPGHRSHYQEHTYAHGNILGLGPGAASFWWADRSTPTTARRWSNVEDSAAYATRLRNGSAPVSTRESPSQQELAREYMLLRLRSHAGLDLRVLKNRYGTVLGRRPTALLDRLRTEGLLHDAPERIRLTPRGRLLADAITRRLLRAA